MILKADLIFIAKVLFLFNEKFIHALGMGYGFSLPWQWCVYPNRIAKIGGDRVLRCGAAGVKIPA
jgi:hypothetical protein